MLQHLFRSILVISFFSLAFEKTALAQSIPSAARPEAYAHIFMNGDVIFGKMLKADAESQCLSYAKNSTSTVKCFFDCQEYYNNNIQDKYQSYIPSLRKCNSKSSNVAIGTSTPSSPIINESTRSKNESTTSPSSGEVRIGSTAPSSGNVDIGTSNPSAGNVGIGSTSPSNINIGINAPAIQAPEGVYSQVQFKIADKIIETKSFLPYSIAKHLCLIFFGSKYDQKKDLSCVGDNKLILLRAIVNVPKSQDNSHKDRSALIQHSIAKDKCQNVASTQAFNLDFFMKSINQENKFYCFLAPQ